MSRVPDRYVERYLGDGANLSLLLLINGVAVLVGLSYYVRADVPYGLRMTEVEPALYPLYADSPTALVLGALSLATLLPNLGRRVVDAPRNRPLAYLHTLAFVWLLKMGIWTGIALNLRPDLYVGFAGAALWSYWGILLTHAGFVVEAYSMPRYGATTRGALGVALGVALVNDVVDYGFGYFPPLRYDPGPSLALASVGVSLLSVALAARAFDRLDEGRDITRRRRPVSVEE